MTKSVRFLADSPIGPNYSSSRLAALGIRRLTAGDTFRLPGAEVDYLTSTFPDCFVVHGAPPSPLVDPVPAVEVNLDVILAATVKDFRLELEAGVHDAYLGPLVTVENRGKARAGILHALAARIDRF